MPARLSTWANCVPAFTKTKVPANIPTWLTTK